jgi:GNAT superfamily N-acetyltransferase
VDQAYLNIVVHPAGRRRGLGRALLQHAAGRAAAHGRTVLNGGARDGSPGEAFARVAGAKPGLVEVQRVLDIGKLEKGKLARLRGPAERAAASTAGTGSGCC